MTNTNYGKFKGIPSNQNQMAPGTAVTSLYSRGQAGITGHNNGQYLPKLAGGGGLAAS